MKKFIKRLSLFLIPVILFIALWEYGLSQIQTSYALKRSQLETQAPKIEVLVLGPSLALRGVNPDYFCMRGYNVANVQQSLFYDSRITLKYIDRMSSLKVVLICIAYPSLWGEFHGGDDSFRDYFYADYWGIRYPQIKWYDIHIYSKILQYGNSISWKLALKGFKVNLTRGYHDNGWAIGGKEGPINDSAGNALLLRYKKNFSMNNLNDNIGYLRDLLQELNRRKIQAVFFTPPSTQSLCRFMGKGQLKTIDSTLSELSTEYHCHRFSFQNDSRFSDSDFNDESHLNQYGAIKFSKIINNEILMKYDSLKNAATVHSAL